MKQKILFVLFLSILGMTQATAQPQAPVILDSLITIPEDSILCIDFLANSPGKDFGFQLATAEASNGQNIAILVRANGEMKKLAVFPAGDGWKLQPSLHKEQRRLKIIIWRRMPPDGKNEQNLYYFRL